jgi:CRP-like cAMP-binding protein
MLASPEPRACAYPVDVELFRQGETLAEVFFIASGTVKLVRIDGKGRESLIGLEASPAWIGSAAVIAGRPTPASAFTCSQALIRRYSAEAFRSLLHEDKQLSMRVHEAHARELCRQSTRIAQLCSSDSRSRLRSALARFAAAAAPSSGGDGVKVQLPFRLYELAGFIGVRPEHLSRLLHDLECDGLIRRAKGWIIVGDVERLADDADENDSSEDGLTLASRKHSNGSSRNTLR